LRFCLFMNPQNIPGSCLEINFNYSEKKRKYVCWSFRVYRIFYLVQCRTLAVNLLCCFFFTIYRLAFICKVFCCDGMRAGCSHACLKRLKIPLIYYIYSSSVLNSSNIIVMLNGLFLDIGKINLLTPLIILTQSVNTISRFMNITVKKGLVFLYFPHILLWIQYSGFSDWT
jgi:hypothetical protein